ncbi:pectate lyase [Anaeromicropila populeti]|uniref:Pectate lyase, PelA/Pel-15E family n=1 Tax=Anaeromicropila populeti TaxID=37658 RepID=A0A1I6L2Q1_9FIRM|nr:pectate lyase [Anaeromicropila populeti]SFR97735.1 pectate lyase, PelA/Pel-15E family [Anaeromicropila populeti]
MLKKQLRVLSFSLLLATGVTAVPTSFISQPSAIVLAAESSVATASISDILKYQQSDGGWRKNYSTTSGDWSKSTIDNGATYTEIRKLAAEYKKTKNSKYSAAALKGINFLLKMQYSNGGWPQVYQSSGYHTHITYNDNAMINVMYLLDDAANKKGDFSFVDSTTASKCKKAVANGVNCILKTQVSVNGTLTIWGQQHDKSTLKPASARAYEVPSLCTSESAAIVKFLKTRTSTSQIKAAITAAQNWFNKYKLTGIKVVKKNGDVIVVKDSSASPTWARFYQIGTNKPIFVGRDGVVKYKLSDIEKERRTGYAWYGTWPSSVLK